MGLIFMQRAGYGCGRIQPFHDQRVPVQQRQKPFRRGARLFLRIADQHDLGVGGDPRRFQPRGGVGSFELSRRQKDFESGRRPFRRGRAAQIHDEKIFSSGALRHVSRRDRFDVFHFPHFHGVVGAPAEAHEDARDGHQEHAFSHGAFILSRRLRLLYKKEEARANRFPIRHFRKKERSEPNHSERSFLIISFDGDALCQISRLIDIATAQQRGLVSEYLQRQDRQERR